ncbi:hypothetical protein [Janthinobacterium sp.]|uniref:hypothetical protein n=1 Tax=Janthinobacterium sp. TaxID=1871054 RepID=UPI002607A113|nr:hypothetical protein [Janthinobacterium sp.]
MMVAIGLLLVLGGLYIMSTAFRTLFLLVLASSIYYGYSVSYLSSGIGPDIAEVRSLLTLYSINMGLFVLAAYLGFQLSLSKSPEDYRARRFSTFKFLLKWGGLYLIFSFIVQRIIDKVVGEDGIGFFAMRAFSPYFAIFFLILVFVLPRLYRRVWRR